MTSTNFSENSNGSISGLSLAHRKLSTRERVRLAADVASGVYRYDPTKTEIAESFKIHPSQLSRELKEREEREAAQRNSDSWAVDHIVMGWSSASEAALNEAVLKIGLARVMTCSIASLANKLARDWRLANGAPVFLEFGDAS
jgi:hypothetical protein